MDFILRYSVPHLISWHWQVALDLFFGGIGMGAFVLAVILDWRFKGKYNRICQTAAIIAPIGVSLGLFFLLLKFDHPFRLFYTYTVYQPSSPLWWGGIFQPIFIAGSAIYAFCWFNPAKSTNLRHIIGMTIFPLALIVGAYHGFLLSLIKANPLWNVGSTPVTAILGFLGTGIATVLLIHLLRMKLAGRLRESTHLQEFITDMHFVRNILGAVLLIQLFTLFIWRIVLLYGSQAAQNALQAAIDSYGLLFWTGAIAIGLVIPLLIGGVGIIRYRNTSLIKHSEVYLIGITSVLVLVGGYIFRWTIVMAGQI